jgi:hypothetical protein
LAPEWTPGRLEVPFPDSTVPMAASTVQGSPGQVAAASSYNESIPAGIALLAAALTPVAVPPLLPESAALTTPVAAAMRTAESTRAAAPKPRARPERRETGEPGETEERIAGERSVAGRTVRALDILGP